MYDDKEKSRNHILTIVRDAITRDEIKAVDDAITAHLQQYPDDRGREMAHGFLHKRDAAMQRASQARELKLSSAEDGEREALLRQVVLAGRRRFESKELLEVASQELKLWQERFPTDPLIPNLQPLIEQWFEDAELTEMAYRQLLEESVPSIA